MTRLDEINKELENYKEIITNIDALKKEKNAILKKIKEDEFKALPLEKQFKKFFTSSKGNICANLLDLSEKAPLFYSKFIDNRYNFNKYRTYDIIDTFEQELCAVYDDCYRKDYQEELGYDDKEFEEEMKYIIAIANELMTNNIIGWKHDW